MKCEYLNNCPFYQEIMTMEKGMGAVYRKTYCELDNAKCARYLVFTALGSQHVPADLYPNMYQKAEFIIKSHSNS